MQDDLRNLDNKTLMSKKKNPSFSKNLENKTKETRKI